VSLEDMVSFSGTCEIRKQGGLMVDEYAARLLLSKGGKLAFRCHEFNPVMKTPCWARWAIWPVELWHVRALRSVPDD
jgi:hypothetical protein